MIINKKQLVAFLEYISLKGLDDDGKIKRIVEDCILWFWEDHIQCYGVDSADNVIFNHLYYVPFTNKSKLEKLIINDIKKWIDYLNSLQGFELEANEKESSVVLTSPNDNAYYNLPLQDIRSIESFEKAAEGPDMIPDGEGWFEDVNRDEWTEFRFVPETFVTSVGAGKNIENMHTKMIITKKNVEMRIGDIKDLSSPTYIRPKVEDLEIVNYVHKGRQEWSCMFGLHPIAKVLHSIEHKELPSFAYKDENKNLIIKTNESMLNDATIESVWAIVAASTPKGYDEESEYDIK